MYIALQSDVGVGMSQQLAKGLYIAPRLQTGGAGFGCLDDHLCMTVSTGNSADRPIDVQRAEFQVKIAPL